MSSHAGSIRSYLAVFGALMFLTALTVWAAFQNFGRWNDVVAMGIATTKATLVVLFFMHLKDSSPLSKIALLSGLAFFALLLLFLFADVFTRGQFGAPWQAIATG